MTSKRHKDLNTVDTQDSLVEGIITMGNTEKEQKKVARRQFLRGAAVGVAGAAAGALAGCAPATPAATPAPQIVKATVEVTKEVEKKPWLPEKWDYEADVVIVGYGGAGAAAAITAADAGAKVLILEKLPADTPESGLKPGDKPTTIRHTCSTRYSAGTGTWVFPDVESAKTYVTACTRGDMPEDVIAVWSEYAVNTKSWFESIGGKTTGEGTMAATEYPASVLPAADKKIRNWCPAGSEIWLTLAAAVEQRGIQRLWEAPGKRLIYSGNSDLGNGEVIGVVAEQAGKEVFVKARKGVVLTTGGFEFDFEMLDNYTYGHPCRFYGNPASTGDGIKMAQAVGADLWHMSLIGGRPVTFIPELGPDGRGLGAAAAQWNPYVHVDKYGRRFMKMPWKNHTAWTQVMWWDCDVCDFPRIPCWVIFDQSAVDAKTKNGTVPLVEFQEGYTDYKWSSDNSAEIAKGWILKGDTIEELAAAIAKDPDGVGKMKPEVLADTISRYNQYCADGKDPEIGSDAKTLLPLVKPPFYAIKQYPGGVNTIGGPKRGAKCEVLNCANKPIPRLYEAGEMGSMTGMVYEGGANITDCFISGQIAGKEVAGLKSWE